MVAIARSVTYCRLRLGMMDLPLEISCLICRDKNYNLVSKLSFIYMENNQLNRFDENIKRNQEISYPIKLFCNLDSRGFGVLGFWGFGFRV